MGPWGERDRSGHTLYALRTVSVRAAWRCTRFGIGGLVASAFLFASAAAHILHRRGRLRRRRAMANNRCASNAMPCWCIIHWAIFQFVNLGPRGFHFDTKIKTHTQNPPAFLCVLSLSLARFPAGFSPLRATLLPVLLTSCSAPVLFVSFAQTRTHTRCARACSRMSRYGHSCVREHTVNHRPVHRWFMVAHARTHAHTDTQTAAAAAHRRMSELSLSVRFAVGRKQ